MKLSLFKVAVLNLLLVSTINAQSTKTIYIDFGYNSTTEIGWNNIYDPYTGNAYSLVDSDGTESGFSLMVTDNFNGINESGAAAEDSLNIPFTGSSDSFFGNVSLFEGAAEPTGEVEISNLDTAIAYSFMIFSSRAGVSDNRETKYTITGQSSVSDNLNVSNNTSEVVNFNDIYPANDGTIRIKAEKGDNNDNSYGFFYLGVIKITYDTIAEPINKSLSLVSPNGGEEYLVEDTCDITWNSENVLYINIDYSIDNGSNWLSIADSVNTSGSGYQWIIPSVESDSCLVRLADISNPTITDESDAFFSIIVPEDTTIIPTITVLSPNGGEEYQPGDTCDIAWDSENTLYIDIDYSIDNGSNWLSIADSVNTSGSGYQWIIPSVESDSFLVRLADISNPAITDESDAFFSIIIPEDTTTTIAKLIQIDFGYNSTLETGWNNVDNPHIGPTFNLVDSEGSATDYSLEVTDNFNEVNTDGAAADASLDVPLSGSSDSFYGNAVLFDGVIEPTGEVTISNLDTALVYTFTIFSSRSGVSDNRETKYTITGQSSLSGSLNVSNNTSEVVVFNSVSPANDGTISVMAEKGNNNNNTYGFFYLGVIKITYGSIEKPVSKTLTITSPNGGEVYEPGQEVTLSWNSTNISSLNIDYSIDNGANWLAVSNSVTASGSGYQWTVPSVESDSCLVRLVDASNPAIVDVSDAFFSISAPDDTTVNPSITVMYPNGGEALEAGQEVVVNWNSTNISSFNIDYSIDNGANWLPVADSVDASGSGYQWIVPSDDSDSCLVRLADVSNPAIADVSDASFSISVPEDTTTTIAKLIQIDFGYNSTLETGWNNVDNPHIGPTFNLVDSEGSATGYSLEVTDNFNEVNTDGAAADASLDIPLSGSSDSFYGNAVLFDGVIEPTGEVTISNLDTALSYTFTIFSSRSGGGDNRATKYTITGQSSVSGNLNVSNNTSEVVVFNNVPPANDGTIRVKAEKGDNNNNSYGFFYFGVLKFSYIESYPPEYKTITLTTPNGGESYGSGNQVQIQWTSTNISEIDIEYSLNNGTDWTEIVASQPASTGFYNWTVPDSQSTNWLIRIKDNSDNTIFDQSNDAFHIISNEQFHIVVLGSSTAEGTGAYPIDSAWVWRYTEYLNNISPGFTVTNLAVGGFNTYDILPSGRPDNNITKALSLNPDAIIINLPSNDAFSYIPVVDQLENFQTVVDLANNQGVPVWIATPQPRDFGDDEIRYQIQFDMVDSIQSIYGEFAIDFWTPIATPEGLVDDQYDTDGTHVNNAGHYLLYLQVVNKNIENYANNSSLITLKNAAFSYSTNTTTNYAAKNYNSVGINETSINWELIKIFPNPVISELYFDFNGIDIQTFSFYNSTGSKIMEQKANNPRGSIDLSNYPDGFYILTLGNERTNYKFIVVKKAN